MGEGLARSKGGEKSENLSLCSNKFVANVSELCEGLLSFFGIFGFFCCGNFGFCYYLGRGEKRQK